MVRTVNVMIGKIQSLAVSEGCVVRHLYNCNDLEQAAQGQRASIHTGRFIKKAIHCHKATSTHTHTHKHNFFPAAHKIGLSSVELSQLAKLDSNSCVASFWLGLGWYDPNPGGHREASQRKQ